MIDMLQNAKELIAKGKALGDPELIQMGMDLLEQYSPVTDAEYSETVEDLGGFREVSKLKDELPKEPQYRCGNCGHSMPVDKEGRKRCPECKKHKLVIEAPPPPPEKPRQPTPQELLEALEQQQMAPAPQGKMDMDQFHMQVRAKSSTRIHYDENGNPDGIIRRREPVDPSMICNIWEDDGEEAQDPANELLKKFTKVSPRTRTPVNYVTVECENCHKKESLHPIHAGGRGRHICEKCIRRRSGR